MDVPVAIAPTIASTDARAALSVIYTDSGEFERYLMLPHPNMVIVDTKVVAGAAASAGRRDW